MSEFTIRKNLNLKKKTLNVVLLHKNFRIFYHYLNTETLTLKT